MLLVISKLRVESIVYRSEAIYLKDLVFNYHLCQKRRVYCKQQMQPGPPTGGGGGGGGGGNWGIFPRAPA